MWVFLGVFFVVVCLFVFCLFFVCLFFFFFWGGGVLRGEGCIPVLNNGREIPVFTVFRLLNE